MVAKYSFATIFFLGNRSCYFTFLSILASLFLYRGVIGGSSWLNPNAYLKHLHPRVDCIIAVSKAVQQYLIVVEGSK